MREMTPRELSSDPELLSQARTPDGPSMQELIDRHVEALIDVPGRPGVSHEDSAEAVFEWAQVHPRSELSFRLALLAQHAHGSIPTAQSSSHPLWGAYCALPSTWRIAIWHRNVEGQAVGEFAPFLALTEDETTAALAAAYRALRRGLAATHPGGADFECREFHEAVRFDPPAVLSPEHVRALEKHQSACTGCALLIHDLIHLESDLREVLVRVVLGDSAEGYLAERPVPPPLLVPLRTGAVIEMPQTRTVVGAVSAALVGAAAVTLVALNLVNVPAPSPAPNSPVASQVLGGTAFTEFSRSDRPRTTGTTGTPVTSGAPAGPSAAPSGESPTEHRLARHSA